MKYVLIFLISVLNIAYAAEVKTDCSSINQDRSEKLVQIKTKTLKIRSKVSSQ